jgi:divalent metal cation (Fe/Co/Zn/Cd) transporter
VITTVALGDRVIWQGWLMIGGLLISVVPPVVLGRLKLKIAPKIALKTLHADADTNKADWMTALAGVLGIAGIGYGWWWADSTAALFIACSILKDGASNLRSAVRDMHDAYPQVVDGGSDDPLVEAIYRAVLAMEFVSQCQVRFHEEGNRLSGVVFVTTVDERLTSEQVASVVSTCRHVSWRIDQVTVTLSGPRETPDLGALRTRGNRRRRLHGSGVVVGMQDFLRPRRAITSALRNLTTLRVPSGGDTT